MITNANSHTNHKKRNVRNYRRIEHRNNRLPFKLVRRLVWSKNKLRLHRNEQNVSRAPNFSPVKPRLTICPSANTKIAFPCRRNDSKTLPVKQPMTSSKSFTNRIKPIGWSNQINRRTQTFSISLSAKIVLKQREKTNKKLKQQILTVHTILKSIFIN